MRPRTWVVLALASLLGPAGGPLADGALASGQGAPAAAHTPVVALFATRPGATTTSLYVTVPGDSDLPAPVATFSHLDGAVVRGSVLPVARVALAVADTAPTRDPSFAASLFRIAPHAPPVHLCDRVVHASRPLVTAANRVFVSRGVAGPELGGGLLRIDELTIDEVDPDTGATSTLHHFTGYLAFLAGSHAHDLFVYRVGPAGADLVALDAASGATRVLVASLPPYARDFSVDEQHGALWFQNRHETDSRTWVVERLDLVSGARARVHESTSMNLAPHAWPGGGVAYNPDGRSGLALLGAPVDVRHPLGDGVDVAVAEAPGGTHVAFLHTRPSRLPVPFAIDALTGEPLKIAAPEGARVAIAGFLTADGGAP